MFVFVHCTWSAFTYALGPLLFVLVFKAYTITLRFVNVYHCSYFDIDISRKRGHWLNDVNKSVIYNLFGSFCMYTFQIPKQYFLADRSVFSFLQISLENLPGKIHHLFILEIRTWDLVSLQSIA